MALEIYASEPSASPNGIQKIITDEGIANSEIFDIWQDSESKVWYLSRLTGGGGTPVSAYSMGWDITTGTWQKMAVKELAGAPGFYGLVAITDLKLDGDVYIDDIKLISPDNGTTTFFQRAFDMDTGVGTVYSQIMGLAVPGAGGPSVINLGREVAADSLPFAIDTESFTHFGTVAGDTSSLDGKWPDWSTALIGPQLAAASVPVTLATDDAVLTALLETVRVAGGQIYSNIFGDCVCTYKDADEVNLLGLSFDPDDNQILGLIQLSDATPAVKTIHYLGAFAYAANAITVTGANFAITDTFIVYIAGQEKAFTLASNVNRSEEIDPLDTRGIYAHFSDASLADGHHSFYVDMSGKPKAAIQIVAANGSGAISWSIWGSVQDDGTVAGSCDRNNIMQELWDRTFDTPLSGAATGAFANALDNIHVVVTDAAHGLANGDTITQIGTTNYNGTYVVSSVTANTFEIPEEFNAEAAAGTWVKDTFIYLIPDSLGLKYLYVDFFAETADADDAAFDLQIKTFY